jgi:hypothetical protein
MLAYKTKSGAIYSYNSEGWKRGNENLRDACYVPFDVAAKAIDINKKGVSAEAIFEQCRKINFGMNGGALLYRGMDGNLKFSSEVISRQPNFKSLEDNVLDWLKEAETEDERRDQEQIEHENKTERIKGKEGTSSGTIGFKEG